MVYDTLRPLVDKYDSFLIDVYGVLYDGGALYKGVPELLKEIMDAGKRVIILSNTTHSSPVCKRNYVRKGLIGMVHYNEFLSSGEIFRALASDLVGKLKKYTQIFNKNNEIFNRRKLHEVDSIKDSDFVYVGNVWISGRAFAVDNMRTKSGEPIGIENILSTKCSDIEGFEKITDILEECLSLDKLLVVVNPDIFAIEAVNGVRRPVICQGAIGWFYESMGGKVVYSGKPYGVVYDYAKRYLEGCERTVMIGDTPWTDILGGNMAGFDTIMTLTGVFSKFADGMDANLSMDEKIEEMLTNVSKKMTHKDLSDFSQRPTYVIQKFA
jgi:HAD superfamily hydrolase (TIGR01450 family)